jgi:hypothetical protein
MTSLSTKAMILKIAEGGELSFLALKVVFIQLYLLSFFVGGGR